MSQATFDDDELFGEAADETREAVEAALADARAELPDPDDIWAVDADNTLGVLNALKGALDTGDAAAQLREAKKQFVLGERAGAFEDAGDLEAGFEELETLLADVETAREEAADLASTIPEFRGALEDAAEDSDPEAGDATADAEDSTTDDAEA